MRNFHCRILCGLLAVWLGDCNSSETHTANAVDKAARGHARNQAIHLDVEQPHGQPKTQLMSLRHTSKTRLAEEANHGEAVLHETHSVDLHMANDKTVSESTLGHLRAPWGSGNPNSDGGAATNHNLIMISIVVVMFGVLGCLLYAHEESEEEEGPQANPAVEEERSVRGAEDRLLNKLAAREAPAACCPCGSQFPEDGIFCKQCGRPQHPPRSGVLSAPTEPTDEDPIHQVEFSDGSWAKAFREARGQRREALELLFRCNIISTQEFAYSRVSQEHIDECVWIGAYMLKQKPLNEWVGLWQSAQQTFEDSVTACFTARTDARSLYGPDAQTKGPPRSEVPVLDCRTAQSQVLDETDADDPYTTRSSLNLSQLMSPTSDYRLEPRSVCSCGIPFSDDSAFCRKCGASRNEVGPPDSSDSIDRDLDRGMVVPGTPPQRLLSPMILRCREIMAAPPQEGVPAQRIPEPAQRVPSPKPPAPRIPVLRSSSVATTVPIASSGNSGSMNVPLDPAPSESSISPSIPSLSPSMANISPSIPSISPAISPVQSFNMPPAMGRSPVGSYSESMMMPSAMPSPAEQYSITPNSVMQRANAAMLRAGADPIPEDGGFVLLSRPTATSPPAASPPLLPGPINPSAGIRSPPVVMGKEADRGGGPVVVRTLGESESEASTAAPSSSQATAKLHGMPGQVKPPGAFPRVGQQGPGSSGEVLVAHVPMNPQDVHLGPLVRIREDRMSGMSSPQSLAGSAVIQRPASNTLPTQDSGTHGSI